MYTRAAVAESAANNAIPCPVASVMATPAPAAAATLAAGDAFAMLMAGE